MPIVSKQRSEDRKAKDREFAAYLATKPIECFNETNLPPLNEEEQRAVAAADHCLRTETSFSFRWERDEQREAMQQIQQVITKQIPAFAPLLGACDLSKVLDLVSSIK